MPPLTRKQKGRKNKNLIADTLNKKVKATPSSPSPTSPTPKEPQEMELDEIRDTYGAPAQPNADETSDEVLTPFTPINKGKGKDDDINQANDTTENTLEDDKLSEASSTKNYTFIARANSYPAKIPIELVTGKTNNDRKHECARIFSKFASFTGCAITKSPDNSGNAKTYMRIFFSDKIDCDAATGIEMLNTEVRFSAENDSETNRRIHAECS